MADSFGTGFFALALLAVLACLAGLLALATAAGVALGERDRRAGTALQYVAVLVLVVVVAVGGFGALATVDEAPVVAALLAAVVFAPLVAVAWRRRAAGTGWLGTLAVTAVAWAVPFLLAGATFVATVALVPQALSLPPSASARLPVAWAGAALAGLVAVLGSLRVAGLVVDRFPPAAGPTDEGE